MMTSSRNTTILLRKFKAGDEQARDALLAHACQRLRSLTHRMLRDYPGVRRWEQTDDVLQNAMVRFNRALSEVPLDSARHFWNLAAQQLRRELIDLARHYLGTAGPGRKHHTDPRGRAADDPGGLLQAQADHPAHEPDSLEDWTAFHEQVEALPEEEREVFNLLWYEGLTQEEAAAFLGVGLRTVKRRWQAARVSLRQALAGRPKG
jgi:RNA polymerase sigma-70 factor (ECF subfamily)